MALSVRRMALLVSAWYCEMRKDRLLSRLVVSCSDALKLLKRKYMLAERDLLLPSNGVTNQWWWSWIAPL
jgi:hypothetical protein